MLNKSTIKLNTNCILAKQTAESPG